MKPFCIVVQSAAVCHACLSPALHPLGQKAETLMNHVCFGNLLLEFLLQTPVRARCLLTHRWDNWDRPELHRVFLCSWWHLLVEQSQLAHLQKVAQIYVSSLIYVPKSNPEFISVNVSIFVWVILWAKGGRFVAGRQDSWQYWNESRINHCREFYRQHFSWAMNKWDYAIVASKAFLWFCLVCLFCFPYTKDLLVESVTLSEVTESRAHYGNLRWYFSFIINAFWLLVQETRVRHFLSANGPSYVGFGFVFGGFF